MFIHTYKLNKKILVIIAIIVILFPVSKNIFSVYNSTSKSAGIFDDEKICIRPDINLNSGWKFIREDVDNASNTDYDDAGWTKINIPHTWNNLDGQDGGNDYYRGVGWYRKKIRVDERYKDKRFYIQFDGSNVVTDVFINGHYLGQHKGGYAAFRFDVTPYIKVGEENIIAVKVDNSEDEDISPLFGDYTFYGGIYRDVHLLITNDIHIDTLDFASPGVYITQNNVSKKKADIKVEAKIVNDGDIGSEVKTTAYIVDDKNTIVDKLTNTFYIDAGSSYQYNESTTIYKPHLWNGKKDPYMYKVYMVVESDNICQDTVVQPLGLRSFYVDADKGFFLNGEYLNLFGFNKHQDFKNLGWAITDKEIVEDFRLMQEIGATAFRTSHYQHSQNILDLSDKYGFVVWSELALNARITDSEAFYDSAKQQLVEMIRQNYNHPSIIFWGLYNEITISPGPNPYELVNQLNILAKEEDPTRLTTAATPTKSVNDPVSWITDTTAFNTYLRDPKDFASWIDSVHEMYPDKKIGISEYGIEGYIDRHSENPQKEDGTEEYQNYLHETFLIVLKERPYLWGKFFWNLIDNASDIRPDGIGDYGVITYDRKTKKDSFYLYKANWSEEPVIYITSRRFNPRKVKEIDVKVYSNMDWVELKVNDQSLGRKKGKDGIIVWENVALKEGENIVLAIGKKDGKTYYDKVVWNRVLSNDATVSSSVVGIDNDKEFIANIPYGTTVDALSKVVTLPKGATVRIYESDGVTPVNQGIVKEGMKVEIIAEDGVTTKTYTIIEGPISLGKNISLSSELIKGETPSGFVQPSHIVDGDNETLWLGVGSAFPQWWKIDLGTVYNLTDIENYWLDITGNNDVQQYKIEVSSNDETYQTVVDRSDNETPKYTQDSLGVPARYVKVTITGSSLDTGPPVFYKEYGTNETTVRGGLIISDKYTIDMDDKKIIIPSETSIETFIENVNFAPDATYKIRQSDGVTEVTTGNIENGMNIIIIAENDINKEGYEFVVE